MIFKNSLLYPKHLEVTQLFLNVLSSESNECLVLENLITNLTDELAPNLSSRWLSDWEQILGLSVTPEKPDSERQSKITSQLRSSGTLSRSRLKEIALSFKNGEVEFVEDTSNYSFIVKFISTLGKPPNFDDFMSAVEKTVPAHLKVTYEFTFNTNKHLTKYNYKTLKDFTHMQLRNEVQ